MQNTASRGTRKTVSKKKAGKASLQAQDRAAGSRAVKQQALELRQLRMEIRGMKDQNAKFLAAINGWTKQIAQLRLKLEQIIGRWNQFAGAAPRNRWAALHRSRIGRAPQGEDRF
jgi:hypothetical protein